MYLTNIASSSRYLKWFNGDWNQIADFVKRNRLHGIELIIHHDQPDLTLIPPDLVQGLHLTYWPVCLDFLRQDKSALLKQFNNQENIHMYYEGNTPQCMVEHYRKELRIAEELKVKYVVFHVSHVELAHIYNWNFTYHDREVLDAFAELINEVFQDEDGEITLLCENLWWPGLNFLNPDATNRFIEKIKYQNKGFMLDIGHLMITNPRLKNSHEAVNYILDTIKNLGEVKNWIKGIHLNKALCGAYLQQDHSAKVEKLNQIENIWDRLLEARDHILNIDKHVPFDHPCIREVIDLILPQYVVFEVESKNLPQFEQFITLQNQALGR
ncbi:MAG: TIM barrel protein [Dehalobacterium sp.]